MIIIKNYPKELDLFMSGFIFAIIAGCFMAVQGVFNTRLKESSSTWVSNTIVHATGLILCIIIWLFSGRPSFAAALNVESKLYYLGGFLGAIIVYTVIKSISDLGPAMATMIILTAQVVVAYLIEVFGLFGTETVDFEFKKLIAVAVMIVGIILFKS